jgi:hypothetical protein
LNHFVNEDVTLLLRRAWPEVDGIRLKCIADPRAGKTPDSNERELVSV